MRPKITQLDIAREARVHPSTVCLALAGKPNVDPETKKRVLAIAKRLGYVRDPMMAALAAYRRKTRSPAFHGVLGWVYNTLSYSNWRESPQYTEYFEGAKARASELGYKIEQFDLADYKDNPSRLSVILRARSVRGILICPRSTPNGILNLNVDDLSVVAFGYHVKQPRHHLVASHHYAAVTEIIRNLRSRGYRRIGFCISEAVDQRMDHTYSAAYYVQRETWPANEHVPRYLGREEAAPFGAWLKKCRPDSVIIPHFGFPKLLADLKIKMPEQLGAAIVSVVPDPELLAFSGVDDDSHEIGQVASSFLTAAIERGERGIPAHPQRILVAGFWREGSTLRALS